MPTPLEIKITAPGAGQSAQDVQGVTRAAEGLRDTTGKMGAAFRDANPEIDAFGRRGGEGRRAVMELDMVMRGGTESVFGLAGAWRSLTLAFAENPFTAILAILFAVVIPAFEALKKSFGDAAKAAEEMQKKNAETFKTAAEDTEKLNEVKLEKFREELKSVEESAKRIIGQVDAVDAAFEKVMHAAAALEIAKIKADPNLTGEEKTARIGQIEKSTRADDRARGISKLDLADAANSQAVADLQAKRDAAQAELERVQNIARDTQLKPGMLYQQLGDARRRLDDAKQRAYVGALGDDDAAAADRNSGDTGVTAALAEVRRLATALEAAEADAQDPQKQGALAGSQATRQKELDDAQKALDAASARAADEKAKNNAARFGIRGSAEYDEQTQAIDETEKEKKARAQDEKTADAEAARINEANAATEGGRVGNAGGFKSPSPAAQKAIDEAARAGQHLADHGGVSEAEAAIAALTALNKLVAEHLVYLNGKPVLQRDVVGEIDRLKDIVAGLKSTMDAKL